MIVEVLVLFEDCVPGICEMWIMGNTRLDINAALSPTFAILTGVWSITQRLIVNATTQTRDINNIT